MAFAWKRLSFNWSSNNSARCHWAALLRRTANIIKPQIIRDSQPTKSRRKTTTTDWKKHTPTEVWYVPWNVYDTSIYMILHVPSKTWAMHAAAYSTNFVHHQIWSRFLACADRWVVRDQINLNIRDHVKNTLPTGAFPLLRQGWKEVACW